MTKTKKLLIQLHHFYWKNIMLLNDKRRVTCNHAKNLVCIRLCDCIGFIVVPVYVWESYICTALITCAYDICKVCYCTFKWIPWVIIFDKRTLEFLMCIFGAFFLNQVYLSWHKVDRIYELKRAHCVVFCGVVSAISQLNNIKHFNFILLQN